MELQWMSPEQQMLLVKLDDGEVLANLKGAGQFQVLKGSTEWNMIEEMEPPPVIADPPASMGAPAKQPAAADHAKAGDAKGADQKSAEHEARKS
jgi:hypothetical protein